MRTCSSLLALSLLVATAACVEAPADGLADRASEVAPSTTAADDLTSRMAYTLDAWDQRAAVADGEAVDDAPSANATARQVVCGAGDGYDWCCVGMYCCFFFGGETICL